MNRLITTASLRLRAMFARARARDPETGNITIEQVLWAVAVIAIVGIVVAAVTGYVETQASKIG